MEAIPNRNVVYVCEGAQLKIYNTNTAALQTTGQIFITGQVYDVREVY